MTAERVLAFVVLGLAVRAYLVSQAIVTAERSLVDKARKFVPV